MRGRLVLAGVFLLAPACPCPAEPPASPDAVADRVEAAFRAGDAAALRALAASDAPDPWLVADALCADGAYDAAAAFAAAAPRSDVEALPAYVAAQRTRPTSKERRAALASASEAQRAKDASLTLERATGGAGEPPDAVGVRLGHVRASALRDLGRFAESVTECERVLEAAVALGWLRRAADVAQHGEGLCWRLPDLPRGVVLARRALGIHERRGSAAGVAHARVRLGALQDAIGEHRDALRTMETALAHYEATEDVPMRALVVGNLGVIRAKLGEVDEALALQEQALGLAERAGDSLQVGRTLHRLGILRHDRGELDLALDLHTRAISLLEAAGKRGEVAMATDAAAMVHRSRGEYDRALALLDRALASARGARDPLAEARALGSLATVHSELRDLPAAVRYREESVRLWERAGSRRSLATEIHNLAMSLNDLGESERALPLIERANALRREVGNAGEVAFGETAAALVLLDLGRKDEALRVAERAQAAAEGGANAEHRFLAWKVLGQVRLERGEPAEALAAFRRASEGARAIRSTPSLLDSRIGEARALRALGDAAAALAAVRAGHGEVDVVVRGHDEELGAGARRRVAGLYEQGALAAASLGDADGVLFFLEAGRAGALREALGSGAVPRPADLPEDLREAEETARLAESRSLARFSRALAAGGSDLDAAGAELDAARERRREVSRSIQRWAKARGGGTLPRALDAAEVRAALDSGDVLVVYAWLAGEVLAVVARRDGSALVRLGASGTISRALAAAAPQENDVVAPAAVEAARTALLGRLGLRPGDRRVLVSPDGPITHVPFPLLEAEREVVFVPSGSTYALLRSRTAARGEGVLALGDPAYGPSSGGLSLARLPSSGAEARAVGDVLLLGDEATEEGLRRALAARPRWRAVHLACHGVLDAERPLLSSLALAPGGGDDGLLVAHEILRMEVPADLVVLSGCDTGRGKAFRGEGVLGLSRAFLLAGAPRVLASLWKVDDEATRAFMETFYARWKAGSPLPVALREARARVRSDPRWGHPRHWAAFVLWGLPD